MGSNQRQTQMEQKANFERELKDRLSILSEREIESREINKDTSVKRLRAKIRAINARLRTIDALEKKTEELATIKAERAAAPKPDPESTKKKEAEEAPVAGKEKKKKAAPAEGTEKKKKAAPAGSKEKKKK
jgi:hypothetical protein